MTTYTIKMYINDAWIDISNYVATGADLKDTLDESLDNAKITIPNIKADSIVGVDFSKPLKPWIPTLVKVNETEEVYRMYVSNATRGIARKAIPKTYRHEIELIEASKVLMKKTFPNITVTQPKSAVFTGKYYSVNKESGRTLTNTQVTPTLVNTTPSNAVSVIEGNTLKANQTGSVYFQFKVTNEQFNINKVGFPNFYSLYTSAEVAIELEVYVDGVREDTEIFRIGGAPPDTDFDWSTGWTYDTDFPVTKDFGYTYNISTATASDREITFKLKTLGSWNKKVYDFTPTAVLAYIGFGLAGALIEMILTSDETTEDTVTIDSTMVIASQTTESRKFTHLDDLVDKMLLAHDIRDVSDTNPIKYTLSKETRGLIENTLAPEITLSSYTLWDGLKLAASIVNAIPEIGGKDFSEISFIFLDDVPDMEYSASTYNDETIGYQMDDYVSGLESNVSNLIEEDSFKNGKIEPYDGGWMSIRGSGDDVSAITEGDAVFKTRSPIFRTYEVLIKGVGVKITNGTTTLNIYGNVDNSYWDISDRVLDQAEWNVLYDGTYNSTDQQRLIYRTRANNIYYTSGGQFLQGLDYKTTVLSDIVGMKVAPRALMETIMTKAAEFLADNTGTYPGYTVKGPLIDSADGTAAEQGIVGDQDLFEGVLARITYMSMTDARSTVYRHNAYELGMDAVNYINEQDTLNDTSNLGRFISTSINKQGNAAYITSGKTDTYSLIPKLGHLTTDGLVVTSRTLNLNKRYIGYTLELTKDFITQNRHLAADSKHRIFEVSPNDTVFRQDIMREFIVLTKDKSIVSDSHSSLNKLSKQKIIQNFATTTAPNESPLSYAKVSVVKELGGLELDNEMIFDLPVNGYPLGTTVNLQIAFDTNYSAGTQLLTADINGDLLTYQSFTKYASRFGQLYSIDIDIYSTGKINNDYADANLYPIFSSNPPDNVNVEAKIIVNKDAREKYGLTFEYPHIPSDSSIIRTYPGIAKYSGLIREKGKADIRVALLENGYWPSVNDTKIKLTRIKESSAVGYGLWDIDDEIYSVYFENLSIPANTRYEGYAVYEYKTDELLYAVKEDIAPSASAYLYDTEYVYFVPEKHLKDNLRPTE